MGKWKTEYTFLGALHRVLGRACAGGLLCSDKPVRAAGRKVNGQNCREDSQGAEGFLDARVCCGS